MHSVNQEENSVCNEMAKKEKIGLITSGMSNDVHMTLTCAISSSRREFAGNEGAYCMTRAESPDGNKAKGNREARGNC
eukprot:748970-Hanusia_phi.AAC.3